MKKIPRHRQSFMDLKPIMEKNKNAIRDWAYAGDEETIKAIFLEDLAKWNLSEGNKNSFFLDDEIFKSEDTVKKFGENLKQCRLEKGWTLNESASAIGIGLEQLRQIEDGERNKINRNICVLACGVYHISPEKMMGIPPKLRQSITQKLLDKGSMDKDKLESLQSPMIFDSELLSRKTFFIYDTLIDFCPELLMLFIDEGRESPHRLLTFLQNTPIVIVLTEKGMKRALDSFHPRSHFDEERQLSIEDVASYLGNLSDIGATYPQLLDIYVSVVAGGTEYIEKILKLLKMAGFSSSVISLSD